MHSLFFRHTEEELLGKRVGLFSYGSGVCSTQLTIKVRDDESSLARFRTLQKNISYLTDLLTSREKVHPEKFVKYLKMRENAYQKGKHI